MNQPWRDRLLKINLLIGALTLTIFAVLYFFEGKYIYVLVESVFGVVLWIALFLLKKIKNKNVPANMGWLGVLSVLIMILFSGGLSGNGLIWWPLLPITSFALFGSKDGIKKVIFGGGILGIFLLLKWLGLIELFFSVKEILQGFGVVVVVSLVMYAYEELVGIFFEQTETKNELLTKQVNLNTQIKNELTVSLKKTEEDKEKQIKVRQAMVNLLEDEKELEKALMEEKMGVEKKVTERTWELSQTKAKLDSSIENLPLGFLMVDVEEKFVVANSLAKKILGQETEKLVLEELKTVLKNKIDLTKYIKNCGKEKRQESFGDVEIGSGFFQFLLSPILTKTEKEVCIGVVILIQDITESKVLERSKDEFFSIASHELRTPLTAIRGNTSMILEYYAKDLTNPELKSMLDDIHESSVRLIQIVNDFLNVSRLEQSRMTFEIKEFDLNGLIKEVIEEYKVTTTNKLIEMVYKETELPIVLADRDKVRQVLTNLVGNSIKFTDKGKVEVSVIIEKDKVKILVKDSGRGIPIKQQNLLFRKFQQAGKSLFTRDTAGGSGLGLYISKMMIEGMNGEIKLEKSEENKGSVFSFTLPIAKNKVE